MNPGDNIPLAVVLLVQIPLVAIWLFIVYDAVRRPDLSIPRKAGWVVLCFLLWPAQMVYLLIRPQHGRAEQQVERGDPHARLVRAAADHEAGRLDDEAFAQAVSRLRSRGHAA